MAAIQPNQPISILVVQWVLHTDLPSTKCFLNPTMSNGADPKCKGIELHPSWRWTQMPSSAHSVRICSHGLQLWCLNPWISLIGSPFWQGCPTRSHVRLLDSWALMFKLPMPSSQKYPFGSVWVWKFMAYDKKNQWFQPIFSQFNWRSCGGTVFSDTPISTHGWNPCCWCLLLKVSYNP